MDTAKTWMVVAVAVAAAAAVVAAAIALAWTVRTRHGRRPIINLSASRTQQIPFIMHQTWKSRDLPPDYRQYQKSWLDLNPGMEYRFYDDDDMHKYVRDHFPEYLDLYEARPTIVEKTDLWRYMVVLREGGFYADMDTSCVKPIEPLRRHRAVVGIEQILPERVQYLQWFFGATPGHPLLREALEEAKRRHRAGAWRAMHTDQQVLFVTGPEAFSAAVVRISRAQPESVRVFPLGVLGLYNIHLLPAAIRKRAYLVHHFRGSWKSFWPKILQN